MRKTNMLRQNKGPLLDDFFPRAISQIIVSYFKQNELGLVQEIFFNSPEEYKMYYRKPYIALQKRLQEIVSSEDPIKTLSTVEDKPADAVLYKLKCKLKTVPDDIKKIILYDLAAREDIRDLMREHSLLLMWLMTIYSELISSTYNLVTPTQFLLDLTYNWEKIKEGTRTSLVAFMEHRYQAETRAGAFPTWISETVYPSFLPSGGGYPAISDYLEDPEPFGTKITVDNIALIRFALENTETKHGYGKPNAYKITVSPYYEYTIEIKPGEKSGSTPLVMATCKHNYPELLKSLFKFGAHLIDINQCNPSSIWDRPAVIEAAKFNYFMSVRTLIQQGANIHIIWRTERTVEGDPTNAFEYSAYWNCLGSLKVLLEKGEYKGETIAKAIKLSESRKKANDRVITELKEFGKREIDLMTKFNSPVFSEVREVKTVPRFPTIATLPLF